MFLTILLTAFTSLSFAQNLTDVVPVIIGPSDIEVGKIALFEFDDASILTESTQIRWYLDDKKSPISTSAQATFTPSEFGENTITLEITQLIGQEEVVQRVNKTITAYDRKIVLLADNNIAQAKVDAHVFAAKQEGIFLRPIFSVDSVSSTTTIDQFVDGILEERAVFSGTKEIILWSENAILLQALLSASQRDQTLRSDLSGSTLMFITDRGLTTIARSVRGAIGALDVQQIIVTRKEALSSFFITSTLAEFITTITKADIGFEIVDAKTVALRPWNLLSSLVNYMLAHGVSNQTILLLLTLPIIATILAFLKQVIGISTLGLYTPSVIALGFINLGMNVGIPLILSIIITGYVTRSLMRKWRLLHIPKVAITITAVSCTLLVLLGIGVSFGLTLSGEKVFILLIMSTLSESFFTLKIESGLRGAIITVVETIGAACFCAFVVQLSGIEATIVAYPELVILVTFVINAILGQWTGLRLVEYFRFRDILQHIQE